MAPTEEDREALGTIRAIMDLLQVPRWSTRPRLLRVNTSELPAAPNAALLHRAACCCKCSCRGCTSSTFMRPANDGFWSMMSCDVCFQERVCWRQAGGLPLPDAPVSRRAGGIIRELAPLLPELLPGLMYTGMQGQPVCIYKLLAAAFALLCKASHELMLTAQLAWCAPCAPNQQALREPFKGYT